MTKGLGGEYEVSHPDFGLGCGPGLPGVFHSAYSGASASSEVYLTLLLRDEPLLLHRSSRRFKEEPIVLAWGPRAWTHPPRGVSDECTRRAGEVAGL